MNGLLRFTTAGSVDDGKSTLIGRLLFDVKAIYEDQLEALHRLSEQKGHGDVDLALLTDGLRAEREQGITIDVAYRYFATPRRKFIIADTPGHAQYTRNMVTGASTAHLAAILIDARNGLVEQSRRHIFLSSLLGIRRLVVCVNKMDLVGWSVRRYEEIRDEVLAFVAKLGELDVTFIPISALLGDNVVQGSDVMPWYSGPTLLGYLETVQVGRDENLDDPRFPVQYVIRPPGTGATDVRRYAGTVASGVFHLGDDVVVLPSGESTRVARIETPRGEISAAFPNMPVTIVLEDDVDVSRGDMLCRPHNRPPATHHFDATICWIDDRRPMRTGDQLVIKHTTRTVRATVEGVRYRLDVNSLDREEDVNLLGLNEIGRVSVRTTEPLCVDDYNVNRATGSVILIDPVTGSTSGAGMIRIQPGAKASANVVRQSGKLSRDRRFGALHTEGATVLLTGLSGSGKSTIAGVVEEILVSRGQPTLVLDGDNLRMTLCGDLGFTQEDRSEQLRRAGEVARLVAESGVVVLMALISPFAEDRRQVRLRHQAACLPFYEIYVDTPLEECERRDPKGLYAKARDRQITGFTGIDSPYEPPPDPELVLRSGDGDSFALAERLMELLDETLFGSKWSHHPDRRQLV